MLPVLEHAADKDRLSFERVRGVTAANPANIFGLPPKGCIAKGMDVDLVGPDDPSEIYGDALHSKCDWMLFERRQGVVHGFAMIHRTVIWDGDPVADHNGKSIHA